MMKFIDLKPQYERAQTAINQRIQAVFEHGQFILGPEVAELEKCLAAHVGVKHCVTVSNGTTALQSALMALNIGPGDEVITSPFSFFATAEVIILVGAKPVFVDIDPRTFNLDAAQLEAAITPATKAIMPVSLYGQCADFNAINSIAQKFQLPVIEDGAQSFGGRQHGRESCGLSTIGCTSFFPSKPLGTAGDGGACFTDDDQLADRLRLVRHHGQRERYQHEMIGNNFRFDSLQAAVLLAKWPFFAEEIAMRHQVAKWYQEFLPSEIAAPYIAPGNESSYAQYTIRVNQRAEFIAALNKLGVPTAIHYPHPLHQLKPLQPYLTVPQHFPNAEKIAAQVVSLPFYPYMPREQVKAVCEALKQCLKTAPAMVLVNN